MARKPRRCPGGLAYHVMNRATARRQIFDDADDYLAFERVLVRGTAAWGGAGAAGTGKRDGHDLPA